MTKTIKSLVVFFFCTLSVLAQDQQLDSLKAILTHPENDIQKAEVLNKIADLYKTKNPEETKKYAQEALALSKKINFIEAEGNAYINLGNYNIITGNYPNALENFRLAKDLFEAASETNYKNELARVYGSIGIVFSEQSSYDKALQYHLKALKIYETGDDKPRLARVYNNIGIVYKAQKDNFKALDYFIKAHRLQSDLNDPTIGTTTTNIGNIYLDQKNYSKAIEYYKQAEKQFQKHPNNRGMGELYNSLGIYYQQMGDNKK